MRIRIHQLTILLLVLFFIFQGCENKDVVYILTVNPSDGGIVSVVPSKDEYY